MSQSLEERGGKSESAERVSEQEEEGTQERAGEHEACEEGDMRYDIMEGEMIDKTAWRGEIPQSGIVRHVTIAFPNSP